MKTNTSRIIVFVVIVAIGIGSIIYVDNLFEFDYETKQNYICYYAKLSSANDILEDVQRQEEHKDLCETEECRNSFGERINNSIEKVNQILEYDCEELLK